MSEATVYFPVHPVVGPDCTGTAGKSLPVFSHKPCLVQVRKTLFVNPGSAGKQRFSLPRCCGLMMIEQKGIRVRFCSLENYKRSLPAECWTML